MRWAVTEKPQAAAILQQASLESITGQTVKVRFQNAHYAEMQAEQERMERAAELLTSCFKRPMTLTVNASSGNDAKGPSLRQAQKKKKELIKEALKDDIVSQAADILGAKLHDVKVEK